MTHCRIVDRGKGESTDVEDPHGSRIRSKSKRFKTSEVAAAVIVFPESASSFNGRGESHKCDSNCLAITS
jgi:hypothetical protein